MNGWLQCSSQPCAQVIASAYLFFSICPSLCTIYCTAWYWLLSSLFRRRKLSLLDLYRFEHDTIRNLIPMHVPLRCGRAKLRHAINVYSVLRDYFNVTRMCCRLSDFAIQISQNESVDSNLLSAGTWNQHYQEMTRLLIKYVSIVWFDTSFILLLSVSDDFSSMRIIDRPKDNSN